MNQEENALNEELARQIMGDGATKEFIIRKGEALPVHEQEQVIIKGNIDSPARWLKKRIDTIEQKKAHVLVEREEMHIELNIDETNHFFTQVNGTLTLSIEMQAFGINTGEYIGAFDMADRIKKYRSYFESHTAAMQLVSERRNFKAKVDKEIEASDDKRGNARFLRSQIVESNLPKSFKIEIPIFKGQPKKIIEVEVEINPDNLSCTLVSPEANDTVLKERDDLIDGVIKDIETTAPEIVIIER